MGLVGDTSKVDIENILALDIVEAVRRIQEPYKNANRKFHEQDTVIELRNGAKIGGGHFLVMAGPASVENEEQIISVAQSVKAAGAQVLRGGAFKPRTSPYAFQGLHEEGIRLLLKAREATGLPIVTEIMDAQHLPLFEDIDIIQVGARNMQNFELLKQLGKLRKPVLLKRGMANTLQELLMSAEYVMAGGNGQVILCERGIRTFETATRNTMDLSVIPVLHSSATCRWWWTPATPRAGTSWCPPWPWPPRRRGPTASSSRSTTTRSTPCATDPRACGRRNSRT